MASYEYDESSAVKADAAASKLSEPGEFIGTFKHAWAIVTDKGTDGISFLFDSPGNGELEFTLYTVKDGKPIFGANFVNAMMFMMGIKSLTPEAGTVEVYDQDQGKRVEVEGEIFPALCNKKIGLVFQKELYTKQAGRGTGERLALVAVFHPENRLLLSEIKEKKSTPVKLDRLMKNLKVRDTRKAEAVEPAQPSMGVAAAAGDY